MGNKTSQLISAGFSFYLQYFYTQCIFFFHEII